MADRSEDRHAISKLVFGYSDALDGGDLEAIRALFAHATIHPQPGVVVRGGDEAADMYAQHTLFYDDQGRVADPWTPGSHPHTRHHVANLVIDVDESGLAAEAHSYVVVFQALDDFPLQPVYRNRYHDSFEKVAGRWRFTRREMIHDAFGAGDTSRHLHPEPAKRYARFESSGS